MRKIRFFPSPGRGSASQFRRSLVTPKTKTLWESGTNELATGKIQIVLNYVQLDFKQTEVYSQTINSKPWLQRAVEKKNPKYP